MHSLGKAFTQQKLPKNRVFWTLCKIASLVFSDFWQKDRVQGTLKYDRKNFSLKIFFFVVNYGPSFFGEIPFDYFLVTCFSWDWLISFFWFLAQRCKMAVPKKWRSPIFKKKFCPKSDGARSSKKNFFQPKMLEICRKNQFFGIFSRFHH